MQIYPLLLLTDTTRKSSTSFDIVSLTLNQNKATNFTTHENKITLLHICSHVINSSHSILGKNGSCLVAKRRRKNKKLFYILYCIIYQR